jgi:replicative DNA helicase|tara:strand:+ start:1708 stop:2922 length:1215 start_codon:yes stop_codon:yes gene_type:complete
MEKQLINLLLKKEFYSKNKSKVGKTVFTNGVGSFYDTIKKAHDKYPDTDLDIDEVSLLHTDVYNPALTRAAKTNFLNLIEDIKSENIPNIDVASDILDSVYKRSLAHKIAIEATNIYNGGDSNFSTIQNLIDSVQNEVQEDSETVTDDIHTLIKEIDADTQYKFGDIPDLRRLVKGVGRGNLVIVFARPETGKTAFWVSLVANRNGFASQGAKVHALVNEEPAVRTQMRLISCWTGMTKDEIVNDVDKAKEEWNKIKSNVKILDTVDWDLDQIDSHCKTHKPDILVVDQLDKVSISGSFARTDEKLRAIYTGAREIAKRNDCCVVAVSQASAEAHGRTELSFDMMENSKTGKAAEADLIIGIGQQNTVDSESTLRTLCVSKNKITGWHGRIDCVINPFLSRYDG